MAKIEARKANSTAKTEEKQAMSASSVQNPELKAIPETQMEQILEKVRCAEWMFEPYAHTFSPADRKRKISSGIKNYGFIEKTVELAEENPQFAPAYFDVNEYREAVLDIERKRALLVQLRQFTQDVSDSMLESGDAAYRYALTYYNGVKDASKRKISGAKTIYDMMSSFFKRRKTSKGEPTETELLRDVKGLLHGKKDGEIIIKNEQPKLTRGVHEVIDEVYKTQGGAREVFEN